VQSYAKFPTWQGFLLQKTFKNSLLPAYCLLHEELVVT